MHETRRPIIAAVPADAGLPVAVGVPSAAAGGAAAGGAGGLRDRQPARWQAELAAAVADPRVLLARLGLERSPLADAIDGASPFRLRVPEPFIRRMRYGDAGDPLLRQVLPLDVERRVVAGYGVDPLEEARFTVAGGLIGKYHGRALLIAAPDCAVHCRYCFRRHFPYEAHAAPRLPLAALAALRANASVQEVILSGGDPLLLKDARLAELVDAIAGIAHVQTLRIHTRTPVVIPSRVTAALLALLAATRLRVVVVVHVNHAAEIDEDLAGALVRIAGTGATLLNQSVLLRGVNDDVAALVALSRALFAARVLPYYLHQLDAVAGAAHFAVDDAAAVALAAGMRAALPGYLVPRLVRERAGANAKEWLNC
jgi:EF-P beta-lysylation protein EpmB